MGSESNPSPASRSPAELILIQGVRVFRYESIRLGEKINKKSATGDF